MATTKNKSLLYAGIAAGVGTLSLALYYFFKKPLSYQHFLTDVSTTDITEFQERLKEIEIKPVDDHYPGYAMTQLFSAIKVYLSPFIKEEKDINKEERKKYLNDIENYLRVHAEYTKKMTQVWEQAAEVAIDFLGIDKDKWAADIEYQIRSGQDDLLTLVDYFPYSVDFIQTTQENFEPLPNVKEMLIGQLQFLNTDFKDLLPHLSKFASFRDLRIVVRNRCFDFVYAEFGVDPDHINFVLCRVQDIELRKLLASFEYLLGETVATLEDKMITGNLKSTGKSILAKQESGVQP